LFQFLKNPKDAFLWMTIFLSSLIVIGLNTYFSFHPEQDIEVALAGFALFVLWSIILYLRGLFAIWHKLRKNEISLLLSLLVWVWLTPALIHSFPIGDYIHLMANYKDYQTKTHAAPNRRLNIDWGKTGWTERTLVYDPTGKLPQENKIKNAEWLKRATNKSGQLAYNPARLTTKYLFGDFYLVEFMN